MRRTLVFQTKNIGNFISVFRASGYDDLFEREDKVKVLITAAAYQELKMLVEEAIALGTRLGAQFLGYIK